MSSKRDLKTRHKNDLRDNTIIVTLSCLYIGLRAGNIAQQYELNNFLELADHIGDFAQHIFRVYPTDWRMVFVCMIVPPLAFLYFYREYIRKVDTMFKDSHGSGGFNDDLKKFNRDYLLAPKIIGGKTKKNQEGKTVTSKKDYISSNKGILSSIIYAYRRTLPPFRSNTLTKKELELCKEYSQILSQEVYMSLDCKFTMRNLNVLYMGASGTGKSRFAVKPNLLQANSSFVVTDPSGEILADVGGFLEKEKGYKIKVLNLKDLEMSCRYNPFSYCAKEADIPVLVNCMKNNIDGDSANAGADGPFWNKSTICLTTACCAYLYEVYCDDNEFLEDENGPIPEVGENGEVVYVTDNYGNYLLDKNGKKRIKYVRNPYWKGHRNFTNVMNMLRMAEIDELGGQTVSDLDKLFSDWEQEHPKSYAVDQYKTFKINSGKTALNVMSTTATTFGTYFDLDDFKNLTFKDEMDIEQIGLEKTAVFLILPEGEKTFNFLAAMFYTQLFQVLYRLGEKLRDKRGGGDPELDIPVRIFLDEMANIGSIPQFNEKLATMRKYRISAAPIFQSLAQLKKMFEKDWEVVLGNCDSMVFLGGTEPSEVKLIMEKLGKATVKVYSYGENFNTRGGGSSTNRQEIGREVLSTNEIECMQNNEQIVFIRGVKPFLTEKFRFERHPNYKPELFTAVP